jgi:FkbM family methyltransferase
VTAPGKVIQGPELQLLNYLRALVPVEPTLVDVGANIGDWTRAVYSRIPHATVFAFEPQAGAYAKLAKLSYPRLQTFNVALGSEEGEDVLLASHDPACLRAGFHVRPQPGHPTLGDLHRHERVKIAELQSVLNSLDVRRLELLKIDVEGSELDVLLGCDELLDRLAIDLIQFEYNDMARHRAIEFKDLWQILEFGYDLFHLAAVEGELLKPVGPAGLGDTPGDHNFLAVSKACKWM